MTGAVDHAVVLRRSPRALWRRLDEGTLLAHPESAAFEELSSSGAVIWELLEEPSTTDQLIGRVANLYGTPAETVAHGVTTLLASLMDQGFLVGSDG
jgi:hypothetical protein